MDLGVINSIIENYKKNISAITEGEIYKWQAVKCFQENWDINATDFLSMLTRSLALTSNLLESKNYYPKEILFEVTQKEPEVVRNLFQNLYNENEYLVERINSFRETINTIIKQESRNKNSFQDHRAIMVYLVLRFPDNYFLYKYEMFKEFAASMEYPYQPQKGKTQNIMEFLSMSISERRSH